jgi:hypothetical protein
MSDWGWVAFAYLVAYGSLSVYGASIVVRIRSARRAIGRVE